MSKKQDECFFQDTPTHFEKPCSSTSSLSSSSSSHNNNTNNHKNHYIVNGSHIANQNSRFKSNNNYTNFSKNNGNSYSQRSRNNNNSSSKSGGPDYNSNGGNSRLSQQNHRNNSYNNNSNYNYSNGHKSYSNNKKLDDSNSNNNSSTNLSKLDDHSKQQGYRENNKHKSNNNNINNNQKGNNKDNNNFGSSGKKSSMNSKSFNYNNNNNISTSGANNTNQSSHNQNYQFQSAPFQPAAYHNNNHSNSANNSNSQSNHTKSFNHSSLSPHHHQNSHTNDNENNNNYQQNNQNSNHVHIPKQFNCNITAQNHKQHKFLIEKYNTKYNLISFILLRKNDEYLSDYKYYFNDQSLYQKVNLFINQRQLEPLRLMFCSKEPEIFGNFINHLEENLADFTNSYNCNLFVYTIRKCLQFESNLASNSRTVSLKAKLVKTVDENNNEIFVEEIEDDKFTINLLKMLFSPECCPKSYFLIDGEFPRRNVMHYAANYNCSLIPSLLLKSDKSGSKDPIEVCKKVLEELTSRVCSEIEKEEASMPEIMNIYQDNNELVLIQLCSQTDFNGNTPIHLAAMNDSYDVLRLINPLCIRYSELVYNEDGLNPFLLACRHSSVEFIKHLVDSQQPDLYENGYSDQFIFNTNLDLLQCRDKVNLKNCLHYACGRGCGNDALKTIKYLTTLATRQSGTKTSLNDLIGAISPLIGSVLHAAASNLTRLSTLWYLLSLYPIEGILVNNESILNSLDFRQFTCVDCLFDAVMNLREMAPPDCEHLTDFYNQLIGHTNTTGPDNFQLLLNRCIYKLSIDFHASFFNLPRIKSQWQLLEFFKLLTFMAKFYTEKRNLTAHLEEIPGNFSPDHASQIYGRNFELFCINFLKKFILSGEILPSIFTSSDAKSTKNSSEKNTSKAAEKATSTSSQTNKNPDESYILNEILTSFYDLVHFCMRSKPESYSKRFRHKIASFFHTYLKNLDAYYIHRSHVNIAKLAIILTSSTTPASTTSTPSTVVNHFVNKNLNSEKPICYEHDTESLIHEENLKFIDYRTRLVEVRQNFMQFSGQEEINKHSANSLINLCRQAVNKQIGYAGSVLREDFALFRLPNKYKSLINFLSYGLVGDLYGSNQELNVFHEC